MRSLKYLTTHLPTLAVTVSFVMGGNWSWFAVVFVFGAIPLMELIMGAKGATLNEAELNLEAQDRWYDFLLYMIVPIQWFYVFWFCSMMQNSVPVASGEWFGLVMAMGILCGSFGINVAHELGHRSSKWEQFFAKMLLASSLYMHFFIEHNRGHHKHVGTPQDPSTARLHEVVYTFWLRSMFQTWMSAWKIESDRLRRLGLSSFSWRNEMLRFQMVQLSVVIAMYFVFGAWATFSFWLAAFMGGIFLETINYIEHYGLMRKKNENGQYEIVQPEHSWNSNHVVGRLILFELSRHSDHHYKSNKKYQTLLSLEQAPQMPTGYPGMMVLSLVAPLWFWVMNARVKKYAGG